MKRLALQLPWILMAVAFFVVWPPLIGRLVSSIAAGPAPRITAETELPLMRLTGRPVAEVIERLDRVEGPKEPEPEPLRADQLRDPIADWHNRYGMTLVPPYAITYPRRGDDTHTKREARSAREEAACRDWIEGRCTLIESFTDARSR